MIYAALWVLFFQYSKFEGNHEFLFIFSAICFLFGFLGTLIPVQFYSIVYKFGAWVLSKSVYYDDMIVGKRKGYKAFIYTIIAMIVISYILLSVSILINGLKK